LSYSYSLSTSRGKVRLLIRDTTDEVVPIKGEHYVFSDAEVDAFLELNSEDVWAAAADGCNALAADEILGALRLKLSGFEIDRTKVPEYWNKLAEKYEKKAKEGAVVEFIDSFAYEISEFGEDDSEYMGDPV